MSGKGRWPDAPGDCVWNFLLPFCKWEAWINRSAVWFNDLPLCTVWSNPNVLLSFISYPSLFILCFLDDFLGHLYSGNSFYHSMCNLPSKTVFHFFIDSFIVGTMYLDHASLQILLPLFQHLQQVSIPSSRPRLLTFLPNPLSSISAPCWSIDWSGVGFVQP